MYLSAVIDVAAFDDDAYRDLKPCYSTFYFRSLCFKARICLTRTGGVQSRIGFTWSNPWHVATDRYEPERVPYSLILDS